MSRKRRKQRSSTAAQPPAAALRRWPWAAAGILGLVLVGVAVALVYRFQPESEHQKLVGRWQRADADYVLEIKQVAADGQIEAAYLNPKPIHVSKAQATLESGKTKVMVELRDRLYPGSYYTLTYEPREDRLLGVYHHLGINQEFDVVFTRIDDDPRPQ
jgi:hypothetical protein